MKKTFVLALRNFPNKILVEINIDRLPNSVKYEAHFAYHLKYLTCEAVSLSAFCLASACSILGWGFGRRNQRIRQSKIMISPSREEGKQSRRTSLRLCNQTLQAQDMGVCGFPQLFEHRAQVRGLLCVGSFWVLVKPCYKGSKPGDFVG